MLVLTKKVEYGLIALTYLARNDNRPISAREVADGYNVPLALLMNILKTLTQRGLVRSVRGARGGYVLAVPARAITMEALIVAIDGPVCLTQCASSNERTYKRTCGVGAPCPVRVAVRKINKKFRELLSDVTLADLVQDEGVAEMSPVSLSVATPAAAAEATELEGYAT
jgi:Rrf2 family protein